MEWFTDCFEDLEDPRSGSRASRPAGGPFYRAVHSSLRGTNRGRHGVFAREKERFLREFLKLEHGLRSHDTFSRDIPSPRSGAIPRLLPAVMARFAQTCQGGIAIDGKVVRRSFDKASEKSALHMVSAWDAISV